MGCAVSPRDESEIEYSANKMDGDDSLMATWRAIVASRLLSLPSICFCFLTCSVKQLGYVDVKNGKSFSRRSARGEASLRSSLPLLRRPVGELRRREATTKGGMMNETSLRRKRFPVRDDRCGLAEPREDVRLKLGFADNGYGFHVGCSHSDLYFKFQNLIQIIGLIIYIGDFLKIILINSWITFQV